MQINHLALAKKRHISNAFDDRKEYIEGFLICNVYSHLFTWRSRNRKIKREQHKYMYTSLLAIVV